MINDLRCLQEIWSGPGVDKDEHLAIASLNSCFEKRGYRIWSACGVLFRKDAFMGWFSAELYDECRACHRSGRVLHDWPSYRMDSIVGRFFFLTQFIRSYGLLFEEAILWILLLKNSFFATQVFDLNSRQYSISPVLRYLFRLSVHTWFYYSLECFVMRFFFAWEYYASLKVLASHWTIASRFSLDVMFEVSRMRVLSVMVLMKFFSSSLSLLMDQKELSMLVSLILTSIIRGTWSEGLRNSG